jgi:single-strand DNA-binding protein
MSNLNSVLIEGDLIRNLVFQRTSEGIPVCTFTLVSNRSFRDSSGLHKEESSIEVETTGKLAEACFTQGQKDCGTRVEGRLKQNRWIDANGERSAIIVVAEHVEFRPIKENIND